MPSATTLTEVDRRRLRLLAQRLDIWVAGTPQSGLDLFNPATMSAPVHFDDYVRGHYRLLAEVCSACVHLVPFHLGESCAQTLLRYSDAELARIAVLVCRRQRAIAGVPSTLRH
jgi:hypothetical protein